MVRSVQLKLSGEYRISKSGKLDNHYCYTILARADRGVCLGVDAPKSTEVELTLQDVLHAWKLTRRRPETLIKASPLSARKRLLIKSRVGSLQFGRLTKLPLSVVAVTLNLHVTITHLATRLEDSR